MKVSKLQQAVYEIIGDEVVDAFESIDIDRYVNKMHIKGIVKKAVEEYIDAKISDVLRDKILRELKIHDSEIDIQVKALVFNSLEKHLKLT